MQRAIVSVSDKTGVVDFVKGLVDLGWEIISTGGTAKVLTEAGIAVKSVSQVTNFPEILEGRVKTLHPAIHGGILAKDTTQHMEVLAEQGITPINLVVVNLYPFQETIKKEDVTLEEAVENIDIGGPTMVRAAAKNFARVAVIVNPNKYKTIIDMLQKKGEIDLKIRQNLALEAFRHTAQYDSAISNYLANIFDNNPFSQSFIMGGDKLQDLRYGENPHQKAAFYRLPGNIRGTIAGAKQLQGKELSYNNIVDVEAAWGIVREFKNEPAVCIIKHTNPCGVAVRPTLAEAYESAFQADSLSAFGGIVGLNQEVDSKTAEKIVATFLEAVVAPEFSNKALEILSSKKNLRLIEVGYSKPDQDYWIEKVSGGFLVQEKDTLEIGEGDLSYVTALKPNQEEIKQLLFAWKVAKHVKSNAIVISKNMVTVGVGAGQMNRVGAAKIAIEQGGINCKGAVLASDAFFPFKDTIEVAAEAGVKAIIQPGGSIRDEEVIQACNDHGVAMVFTGKRHFKH